MEILPLIPDAWLLQVGVLFSLLQMGPTCVPEERMELRRKHYHFLSSRHALSSGDLVSSDSVITVLTIILTISAT